MYKVDLYENRSPGAGSDETTNLGGKMVFRITGESPSPGEPVNRETRR
jgi:hypothetical protein